MHDDQDEENDQANDEIVVDHEFSDGADDLARFGAGQDQAGGGDVEGQPEQGGDQQQRREGGEIHRPRHIERHQQDGQREREV